MKPVIGFTSDLDMGISAKSISPGRAFYFLSKNNIFAIEKSGGIPLILPCINSEEIINSFLEKIDGLVLSGGVDLDPSFYKEEPSPYLGAINPERASFEVMITHIALEKNMPILGICGGEQLLNVVAGGTLFQDINTQVSGVINHRQRAPRWYPFHNVEIKDNTKLKQILKTDSLRVNSRHHQSVKDIANGFIINAVSSDGIVEGIESTVHKFVIGVQWHPEEMFEKNHYSKSLFQALIKACQS